MSHATMGRKNERGGEVSVTKKVYDFGAHPHHATRPVEECAVCDGFLDAISEYEKRLHAVRDAAEAMADVIRRTLDDNGTGDWGPCNECGAGRDGKGEHDKSCLRLAQLDAMHLYRAQTHKIPW